MYMQVSMGELLLAGTHPSGVGVMLGLLLHRRPSEGQGDLLPVRHWLLQGSAAVKRSVTPKSSLVNISLWTLCISMTYNDSRLVQATDALFFLESRNGNIKDKQKKSKWHKCFFDCPLVRRCRLLHRIHLSYFARAGENSLYVAATPFHILSSTR